jgi:hypothetical protein
MEFERQYAEYGGKRGVPLGKEKCLMWSAGWARGVLMWSAGWARGVHQQNVF